MSEYQCPYCGATLTRTGELLDRYARTCPVCKKLNPLYDPSIPMFGHTEAPVNPGASNSEGELSGRNSDYNTGGKNSN